MTKKAFTLIELMVVVAVIAILAALAVSNFSSAIKRARNAGRQSDITAVAKALETCYDVPSGTYTGLTANADNTSVTSVDAASGPFQASANVCLNANIGPGMATYPYYYTVQSTAPQGFVLCAKLEKVANWGSVGNTTTLPVLTNYDQTTGQWNYSRTKCTDEDAECYFCITNQQ